MSAVEPTPAPVLTGLIRLEDVRAEVARRVLGSGRLEGEAAATVGRLRAHALERSVALRAQLEALGAGLDGPEPLVLDPEFRARLDRAASARARLELLARLERVAVDTYARALPRLEVPEIIATVASAMGGHAQHLTALRLALGVDAV